MNKIEPFSSLYEGLLEGVAHEAVDEKVGRGVDNEEPVVKTGQTKVPDRGTECFRTAEHFLHHEELNTVEDDTGSVAEEKDDHDANEDGGEIHLVTLVLVGLHVSVP